MLIAVAFIWAITLAIIWAIIIVKKLAKIEIVQSIVGQKQTVKQITKLWKLFEEKHESQTETNTTINNNHQQAKQLITN